MKTISENKQTKFHSNSWKYYNDLEGFCIYFYKRLRGIDPKAYNVKTDEEVLEFYQNSPHHLEFITAQWNARIKMTNEEQARKSTLVFERGIGIWAMSPETKKAAERLGGTSCINKRKEDPIKWAESLKPGQVAGGKKMGLIQGKKNVESGHWDECIRLGAIATKKRFKEQRDSRANELLPQITCEWVTKKAVCDWYMQTEYPSKYECGYAAVCRILDDERYFQSSGNGKNKRFKKIINGKKTNIPGDPVSRLFFLISKKIKDSTFQLNDLAQFNDNFKDIKYPKGFFRSKLKDSTKYTNLGQLGTGRGGGPFTYKLT